MNYVCHVPIEVATPISMQDPDVRSIVGLPGFIRLGSVAGGDRTLDLEFEIEGGSNLDAADAAEEVVLSVEDALDRYRPRLLAQPAVQAVN